MRGIADGRASYISLSSSSSSSSSFSSSSAHGSTGDHDDDDDGYGADGGAAHLQSVSTVTLMGRTFANADDEGNGDDEGNHGDDHDDDGDQHPCASDANANVFDDDDRGRVTMANVLGHAARHAARHAGTLRCRPLIRQV